MSPDTTQNSAAPRGSIETASENSVALISYPFSSLRSFGRLGEDQAKEIPNKNDPKLAEKLRLKFDWDF